MPRPQNRDCDDARVVIEDGLCKPRGAEAGGQARLSRHLVWAQVPRAPGRPGQRFGLSRVSASREWRARVVPRLGGETS